MVIISYTKFKVARGGRGVISRLGALSIINLNNKAFIRLNRLILVALKPVTQLETVIALSRAI